MKSKLLQSFLNSRFHQWLLQWKPIPLCWWFVKHGKPVPRYLIGHSTFSPAQNKFRFYEDGTESGSTPIAAESTNITRTLSGNSNLHLRVLLQETGGAAGATTDDYQLQYSLNGGSYTNITTSSSVVKAFNSSNVTDSSNTTNRATNGITDGTGSFVAGEISEDGLVDDHQLTASGFTEHLYTLTVIDADTASNDTIDFRVLVNGSTMTYNVTPRITVAKTAPAAFAQNSFAFYEDGTEAGSALATTRSTYYFDASDAAATDPNAVWSSDANAFDGNVGAGASTSSAGSTSSNYLMAEGTNAPASGGTILAVRARLFNANAASTSATIYTDGLAESLGTATVTTTGAWGDYTYLSTPSGGWTWAKIQALEVKIYKNAATQVSVITRVEIDVLTTLSRDVTSDSNLQLRLRVQETGGGTSGASTDDYQLQYSKNGGTYTNVNTVVDTYYFNASDAGPTDPNAVWSSDANAFDGSTSTNASTSSSGSTSSNYLMGEGTNAPTSGNPITQVRVRVYGNPNSSGQVVTAAIYTNGLSELLGSPVTGTSVVAGWGSYTTLSTPSGGWTWQTINDLEAKIYAGGGVTPGGGVRRVELEVTSVPGSIYYFDASDALVDVATSWSNDANAFDGSTSTFASTTVETAALRGEGTNAPTSGGSIAQVRARIYGYGSGDGIGTASYGDWVTLIMPTGGWTWQKINDLEANVFFTDGGAIFSTQINATIKTDGGAESLGAPFKDGTTTGSGQTGFVGRVEIQVIDDGPVIALNSTSLTDGNATAPRLDPVLADNFNDNSLDTALWTNTGGSNVNETNQRLEITTNASAAGSFFGFHSASVYNFTGAQSVVEAVSVGNQSLTSLTGGFSVEKTDLTGDDQYMIYASNGSLVFRRRASAVNDETSITYDSTAHRWWRIREASGTIFMDTSPDGTTWTNRRSFSGITSLTATAVVQFFAGTSSSEASASSFIFDNYRLGPYGSFIAGEVSEDGLVDDYQLTAGNYTEHVYALTLGSDYLSNGDTLDFQVLRNGSALNTYSVTPRIVVTKTAASSTSQNNSAKANIRVAATNANQVKANIKKTYPATISTPNTLAGTGADDASIGSVAWSNPGNITTADTVYATANGDTSSQLTTHYLKATNFGFAIPTTAIVRGIVVDFVLKITLVNAGDVVDNVIKLVKAGNIVGDNKADPLDTWGNNDVFYGSSTDLWGTTWSPADVNNSNFGVVLSANIIPNSPQEQAAVDAIKITVYYTESPTDNSVKANIKSTTSKDTSVKGNILAGGQQPHSVKADILVINTTKNNLSKADILVNNSTANNSVKANIKVTNPVDNTVKSNIKTTYSQNNSVKADILVTDNTNNNYAKASIVVTNSQNQSVKADVLATLSKGQSAKADIQTVGQQSNSTKANILVSGTTQNNSVKANILIAGNTDANSVKANLRNTYTADNSAKANIRTTYTQDTSAKANIKVTSSQNNSTKADIRANYTADNSAKADILVVGNTNDNKVKADINATYTDDQSVKANTLRSYTQDNSVKVDILTTYTQDSSAKADILVIDNTYDNSVKANLKLSLVTYSQDNSVKANIIATYTKDNTVLGNLLALGQQANFVKANILSSYTQNGSVKADILVTYTANTAVKADILNTYTANNSAKVNVVVGYTQGNQTKANILTTYIQDASVKANIPGEKSNFVKANILVIATKDSSVKAGIQAIGQQPNSVKADIFTSYAQNNSVKTDILVADNTSSNKVKANLLVSYPQDNSVKANIKATTLQANSAKADILVSNNTVNNSVKTNILVADNTDNNHAKANILVTTTRDNDVLASINAVGQYPNSVKANILVTGITKNNSAKTDILVAGNTDANSAKANIVAVSIQDNSVKANIPAQQTNSAKANLLVATSKDNSVKADIQATGQQPNTSKANILITNNTVNNFVKADILITDNTADNKVEANIDRTYSQDSSIKTNIKAILTQNNSVKADILVSDNSVDNSTRANVLVAGNEHTNQIKANILRTYTQANTAIGSIQTSGQQPNSVKANILQAYTQDNVVKADILVINNVDDNVVKSNILTAYAQNNSAKANIKGTSVQDESVKVNILTAYTVANSVKANIPAEQGNLVKANILVTEAKDNNVKADIVVTGQVPSYVKADILVADTIVNTDVKANILVLHTDNTSVKSNLLVNTGQNESVKANILRIYTQDTSGKGNIVVVDNTAANSVKENILVTNVEDVVTKANILVRTAEDNQGKANVLVVENTASSQVKGNILVTTSHDISNKADVVTVTSKDNFSRGSISAAGQEVNAVKANILTTYTKDASVKASINGSMSDDNASKANILTLGAFDNNVIGNVTATITAAQVVKANILVITTRNEDSKANLLVTGTQENTVKANIPLIALNTSSAKANIVVTQTKDSSVKANFSAGGQSATYGKANILVTGGTQHNVSKANIRVQGVQANSNKADIRVITTQAVYIKANLVVQGTADNQVKALITPIVEQMSKANIFAGLTQNNTTTGNITILQGYINAVRAFIISPTIYKEKGSPYLPGANIYKDSLSPFGYKRPPYSDFI